MLTFIRIIGLGSISVLTLIPIVQFIEVCQKLGSIVCLRHQWGEDFLGVMTFGILMVVGLGFFLSFWLTVLVQVWTNRK